MVRERNSDSGSFVGSASASASAEGSVLTKDKANTPEIEAKAGPTKK